MAGRPRRRARLARQNASEGTRYQEVGQIEGWETKEGQVGPLAVMYAQMGHYGPSIALYYDMTRRRISVSAYKRDMDRANVETVMLDSELKPGDYPYVTIPDDIRFTFLGDHWLAGVFDRTDGRKQLLIMKQD